MIDKTQDELPGKRGGKLTMFVQGRPSPGGSKTVYRHASGRALISDAGGKNTKAWREAVAAEAIRVWELAELLLGPLNIKVTFYMPRAKNHYKRNEPATGQLKASAPQFHTIAPDATKLLRSTEDALTGIVYRDDAQIVCQIVNKLYTNPNNEIGAHITIERAD